MRHNFTCHIFRVCLLLATPLSWCVGSTMLANSSELAHPEATFMPTTILLGCGEPFFDPGGPDNDYNNGEYDEWTFCPDNVGDVVTLTFSFVQVEACCDELAVYNGNGVQEVLNPDIEAPASFTSTAADGCLRVSFDPDGSVPGQGWVASVDCGPPADCTTPSDLTATIITSSGASIGWMENDDAILWDVEVVEFGTNPSGTPTNAGVSNPFVWSEGNSGTTYQVYVRSVCPSGGTSNWSVPLTFTTSPGCGDRFFDSGGPNGDFSLNEDVQWTFCPDEMGDVVSLNFSFIDLGFGGQLNIYNGTTTDDLLFASVNTPGIYTSEAMDGCLTVEFTSGGFGLAAGWVSRVLCAPPSDCTAPIALTANNFTATDAELSWVEGGDSESWDIEIVPAGTDPTGEPTDADVRNPYTWTNGTAGTAYNYYVRANCPDGGNSYWAGPFTFSTSPGCGDNFYDLGGELGDYADDQIVNWVICPDAEGDFVRLEFTFVDVEACCDEILVYDGVGTGFPIDEDVEAPAIFISSSDDGCLTVGFQSDGSVTNPGWEAMVTCVETPACPTPSGLISEAFTNVGATLSWFENGEATSWDVEIVPAGQLPTGTPTIDNTTENLLVWEGGMPNTVYNFYVRANCPDGDETSDWAGPTPFATLPGCGDTFVDLGGADGNYPSGRNDSYLICPDSPDDQVILTFTDVNLNFGAELLIFNGSDTEDPIGTPNFQTSTFVSTADDGCLTVTFSDEGSAPGWVATVECRLALDCPDPSNLELVAVSTMGATISWEDNANAVFWDVQFVPSGSPVTDTPTERNVFATTYTWTGAQSGVSYDAYVRAQCPGTTSNTYWIGPVTFLTLPSCGSTFFDSGGPDARYSDNENEVYTICPDAPGVTVELDITEILIQRCCDVLSVYNGQTTDQLIAADIEDPATFVSTSPDGCLTITMDSDFSGVGTGWEAAIGCTTCSDVRAQGAVVTINNIRHNLADVSWESFDQNGDFTIEFGTAGFTPGNGTVLNGSGTQARVNNLDENTAYELYLVYTCTNGDTSIVEGPLAFTTPYANDVGIFSLDNPTEFCGLGVSETITVSIINYGGLPQSLIPLNFSVNGELAGVDQPRDGFYTGVLTTDSIDQFTFDLLYDFLVPGENVIQLWTELETDSNNSNDTLTVIINRFSPPFYEDFESGEPDPILQIAPNAFVTDGHGAPSFVLAENLFGFNNAFTMSLPAMSGILPQDTFFFDYRIIDFDSEGAYEMVEGQNLVVTISEDCGETTEIVFLLLSANQVPTDELQRVTVPLAPYVGSTIQITITADFGGINDVWLDIDNIAIPRCNGDLALEANITPASSQNASDGAIGIDPTLGLGPFTYNWSNGAETDSLSNLAPGTYDVTITDQLGCTQTTMYTIDIINSTEDLVEEFASWTLAPNPTRQMSWLDIQFKEPLAGQMQLFNTYGQAVGALMTWDKTERLRQEIDLSEVPAGLYFLRLQQGQQQASIKILKVD